MLLEAPRAVRLIPFSACKLPVGTTKLELVTSGRSVWISLWVSGQYSAAEASTIPCPSAARRARPPTRTGRHGLQAGYGTPLVAKLGATPGAHGRGRPSSEAP